MAKDQLNNDFCSSSSGKHLRHNLQAADRECYLDAVFPRAVPQMAGSPVPLDCDSLYQHIPKKTVLQVRPLGKALSENALPVSMWGVQTFLPTPQGAMCTGDSSSGRLRAPVRSSVSLNGSQSNSVTACLQARLHLTAECNKAALGNKYAG